jgi:hypothetical protein
MTYYSKCWFVYTVENKESNLKLAKKTLQAKWIYSLHVIPENDRGDDLDGAGYDIDDNVFSEITCKLSFIDSYWV